MTSIACPNCTNLLAENGRCDACGLDGTLLLAIRSAARELAREAARRAGEGAWYHAYELAAESLRLMWRDNDLAAFVVLAAAVSGVRGSVRFVPQPRTEHLPEALAPHVNGVLATAEWLRQGGNVEESSLVRRGAEEVPAGSVLSPSPLPWWRSRSAGFTTAAVVLVAVGVLVGGGLDRAGSRETLPPADLSPALPVPLPLVAAKPVPPTPAPAMKIPLEVGRVAWHGGREASYHKNYAKAREHLEIAVRVPPETYYWDDALYFLAKAYHRLHEREKAGDAYDRVIRESPDPGLRSEAERLRNRLERGEGVDG